MSYWPIIIFAPQVRLAWCTDRLAPGLTYFSRLQEFNVKIKFTEFKYRPTVAQIVTSAHKPLHTQTY